jgi:NAD(P)-dependent dehydrogenase (short-subunit alcohol dehydrogenase family)
MKGTALVTGCSSGIGLRTAVTLARHGYRVLAGVRSPERAGDVRRVARTGELAVTVIRLDVTDPDSVAEAVAAGVPDVVVNNAGIGMFGAVENTSDEDLRLAFDTNFFGALSVIRAALPRMRERGGGVVVNIGSVDACLPGRPITWAYAASKHALGVASEGLALEVEPFGIRVRQIDPGFFATNILDNRKLRESGTQAADGAYRGFRFAMESAVAASVSAAGDPQDVADAVLDAVTDEGTHPVRRLVGADAKNAVALMKAAADEQTAARQWKDAVGLR